VILVDMVVPFGSFDMGFVTLGTPRVRATGR
jgi:hypothetical protein